MRFWLYIKMMIARSRITLQSAKTFNIHRLSKRNSEICRVCSSQRNTPLSLLTKAAMLPYFAFNKNKAFIIVAFLNKAYYDIAREGDLPAS